MKRIYIDGWTVRLFTVFACLLMNSFWVQIVIANGAVTLMHIVMGAVVLFTSVSLVLASWSTGVFIDGSKNRIYFAIREGISGNKRFERVLDGIRRIDVRWEKSCSSICFIITYHNGYVEELRHVFWRTLDIYIRFCFNRLNRTFAKLYPSE